jgi:glucose/arabinose dehydrogenase/lysophospholipase L1-like esterase/azurin
MKLRPFLPLLGLALHALHAEPPAKLALRPGEHIAILGEGLADRMQHTGWLETLLQQRFAPERLVFRNLAVSGDEVATWHRSQDFGERDEWLAWTAADVIFAFYGFNESFKGYEGIEKFKADLGKFLKDTAQQNYSGRGAPRVVLFSPTAAERHRDANFPDPQRINTNVQNYTQAMAEVARANGVPFIDLYTPSLKAFAEAAAQGESLTVDGLQLTAAGEKALAPAVFQALTGESAPTGDLEPLRAAVLEKNEQWHQRYRTIDGYNVYGGRSRMGYAPKDKEGKESGEKIFNNPVMQREMQQRDVLTANRDELVWATALGLKNLQPADDNLPPALPVATNKPGDQGDLSWTYPSGEEAIAKIKVHPGCKINLFADEKMFPELANPVQMAWDTKGRLWVAVWPNYPEAQPTTKVGDKLLIFEDTDGDGKADKCTTFLDGLNAPTGFTFYKDGVLVMQAPDLWYVPIDKTTGKAGPKERVIGGIDSADSHHTTNAMSLDPGGATYLSDGVFHRTQIETARGPLRYYDGNIWRFEPRTGKVDNYISYGFANPHGKVWDYWGNDLITDATGNASYFGPAFSGRLDEGKHPALNQFWARPSRPCPNTGMVSSRHFPDDWQGNFLNCNVISFQGIYRVGVAQDGSGLKGETLEPLVSADPAELPTFRPICVSNGPDGAIYFCDWSQTIIGHLQHHLRDPNRDHQHGRIYRITYEGRPLLTPPKIDGQPIAALLDLLKLPENDIRTLAKVELGQRETSKVIAAVKLWVGKLDKNDPAYAHQVLEALWVHQWHNVVDLDLLKRVLASPNPQARTAAVRVLCYWRDRVPGALALLKTAAGDEDPRVRLQAVRAASFFDGKDAPEAMRVAFESLKKPGDYYLDYVFTETLRQLRTQTTETILPSDPAVLATYVTKLSDGDLDKAPDLEPVLVARLERKSSDLVKRDTALQKLVKLHHSDPAKELIASLQRLDAQGGSAVDDLAKMLTLAPDLAKARPALSALADQAQQKSVRRAALAALFTADANPEATWASAKDAAAREQLLIALASVSDPALRAKLQPTLAALLADTKTAGSLRRAAFTALPLMGPENAASNFPVLATALRTGTERTTAARAIMQLPRDSWKKDEAAPIAESILAWAKTVPGSKWSDQDYVETIQVAQEMAGLLPPEQGTALRKELRRLSVAVFVVKTVHEQMRYDTPRLVVEAGKPFEVIFENADVMPHNLVFVQPGTRKAVAEAAQSMAPTSLDKEGRAYLPKAELKSILGASKLIEPGQRERLKLTAPGKEGDCEYVCTFPGHWMIMWGQLVVTKDVDAYLQAHPQAAPVQPSAAIDHRAHQHAAAR